VEVIGFGRLFVYCTINSGKSSLEQLYYLINQTIAHETGIMCFRNPYKEREWTKRDVFEEIHPAAFDQIDEKQYTANRIILMKCSNTLEHIEDWCQLGLNAPHLFDDSPSVLKNAPEFKENRHDQSVFSLLSKRRGCLEMKFADINPVIALTRIRH